MAQIANREIRLASRPKGIPTAANFTLARTELEPLRRPASAGSQSLHVGGPLHARSHERREIVCSAVRVGQTARRRRSRRGRRVARQGIQTGRCRHFQLWLAGILHCFAERVASGQPRDSAALGLPWRPRHDGHDRLGRVEFGGGQSRRRHFHFGSRRRRRQCGRATGEIARVPCHRVSRFNGEGHVSAGRMWV